MAWHEGYVSEINYTYGFYGELSPARLAFATLIKMVQPPNITQSFNYCELGCGYGYTTNLLAASYPQARFYATDFNPSHIATAKTLAEEAILDNIHFFDDSFEQFIERDLPQFDFICLHGVYSWIAPENRQAIVRFIEQKLKVRGLVYLSYNALPGWAAAMPLRELFKSYEQRVSAPIAERLNQALNFAGELLNNNAAYFVQNPSLKTRYENINQQNRNYLAYEYFCQDWHPFYFNQVVQELEPAKLSYIGSAHLADHIDMVNLTQAAQEELAKISDPIYREVIRDYFLNNQFRRDIFSRGTILLTPPEQTQQLQKARFALVVPRSQVQLVQKFPIGEVTLQDSVYNPICDALVARPLTLEELQTHTLTTKIPVNSLFQALVVLSSVGYVSHAVDDITCQQRKSSTDRFNAAVMSKSIYSTDFNFLASPLIGTGIMVGRLEQLFLMAKSRNQDMAEFTWQILKSHNQNVVKEGKTLETPAENLACLQEMAQEFSQSRLELLQKLGII